MKILILLLSILNLSFCYSQSKRDYIWVKGNEWNADEAGIQAFLLNFNNQERTIEQNTTAFRISGNCASICDVNGNILLYSNGCSVANSLHQIMPNGDSINSGSFRSNWLGDDCTHGYNGSQDIMILPDPASEEGYYLIHKPREYNQNENPTKWIEEIRYSYIDMALNDGLGDVTEKNVVFFNEGRLLYNYLTAINHSNGKDWWIIQPKEDDNVYYTFLLDENGIELKLNQEIGPVFDSWGASATGSAKFSPDGTMYAYYNAYDQLLLYDFDRATGVLNNLRKVSVIDAGFETIFSSVEWSPNNQFIYLASNEYLYQVDLDEENLEDGVLLIDEWNGIGSPFPATFFLMSLAPYCKIYMTSTNSMRSYHVINSPNNKGKDCNFAQLDFNSECAIPGGTMPNFPRFRVDEDEVCDSSIVTSYSGQISIGSYKLSVHPNPASEFLQIDLPSTNKGGNLKIINLEGKLIELKNITHEEVNIILDIRHLNSGYYFAEFVPNKFDNKIYTAKFFINKL